VRPCSEKKLLIYELKTYALLIGVKNYSWMGSKKSLTDRISSFPADQSPKDLPRRSQESENRNQNKTTRDARFLDDSILLDY
jgi:hypothetical protein